MHGNNIIKNRQVVICYLLRIIIIFCLLESVAFCSILGSLEVVGTSVKYEKDGLIEISVVKLLFLDRSGDLIPSNERYIVLHQENGYPIIGACISGHTVDLKLKDVDEDQDLELLVFYFSGGNQYALELFEISKGKIIPFKNQPNSSNMRSIEVKNKKIIVKNILSTDNVKRKITSDVYVLSNGDCILSK